MSSSRPFAYNPIPPNSLISGTTQVVDLSIGTPLTGFTSIPQYWNGPNEDLGYVIARSVSGNTQPTPVSGIAASVSFLRTKTFSDSEFITLSEYTATKNNTPQTFSSANDASIWLTNNGFWNSYIAVPPSPTPTTTITPTNTTTQTITPTNTETPTPEPTQTPTNTSTPTNTVTQTQTQTPTNTITPTNTASQTQTPTPSITASQTNTPTPSITASQTPTPSITASQTVTPTVTQTRTPTPTTTKTSTPTPTQTRTPTPTAPSTLKVYFDISNSLSYPGSGSAITDLSGTENNATLSGDYSYSSSNSGTIVMGGTNSLANITQNATINISNTSTPVSVVIWAKVPAGYANNDGIWNKQLGASTYDGYRLSVNASNSLTFGFNGNSQNFNTSSGANVFTANTFAMFTMIIQAGTSVVYVNGNSTPVISQATNDSFSSQANLQIGQSIQGDNSYLPMTWGQFRYYVNKALSTAEILALFNTDKTKYGL